METIEEIVLRHSARGMTYLSPSLPKGYCARAAQEIMSWKTGTVLLLTGFQVNGVPETDGPAGTYVMAKALLELGFFPVVVSEEDTCSYFSHYGIATWSVRSSDDAAHMEALLDLAKPRGVISIERCGRNTRGRYCNMRGVDIGDMTSPVDELVLSAGLRDIATVAVGDGGNEIGMGNVASLISEKLSLDPCAVPADQLVVATVSNWGAYGIVQALSRSVGKPLLPDYSEIRDFYEYIVGQGSVDGTTGLNQMTVDGFTLDVEQCIVERLRSA